MDLLDLFAEWGLHGLEFLINLERLHKCCSTPGLNLSIDMFGMIPVLSCKWRGRKCASMGFFSLKKWLIVSAYLSSHRISSSTSS